MWILRIKSNWAEKYRHTFHIKDKTWQGPSTQNGQDH